MANTEDPAFMKSASDIRRKMNDCLTEMKFIYDYGKNTASKSGATQSQIATFKGMMKGLENYHSRFDELWDQLSDHYANNDAESQFPTSQDSTNKTTARSCYFSSYGMIETLNASASTQSSEHLGTNISHQNQTLGGSIRLSRGLPKIHLPTFDGELLDWPQFRDTFHSLVHVEETLSTMEKFHYLRTALKGCALAVINHFVLEESNYELAWKAIHDTYNNKRMLASVYLDQILNFKPMQGKATPSTLKHYLSKITDNISAFNLLKIENKADFILFHLAIRCLDSTTRDLFEMSYMACEFPTVENLSKFVRERCLALQLTGSANATVNDRRSFEYSQPREHRQKFTTNRALLVDNGNPQKGKTINYPLCIVCKSENHHLLNCRRFHQSSADQRWDALQGFTGCFNCLDPFHSVQTCKSNWHCRFCPKRHHTSLHRDIFNETSSISNSIIIHPATDESEEPSTSSSLNSITGGLIILGTALAEVMDSLGNFQQIRMVIDSGSQNSFVTHKCLNKLGLKLKPTHQKICGIGQTPYQGAKGKSTLTIKPVNTNSPLLNTEAIVVSSITSNLPSVTLPTEMINLFLAYDLADPKFWESHSIDFLLGADLFPEIWTGSVHLVKEKLPKLFASIFGHIVIGKFEYTPQINSTNLFTMENPNDLTLQLQRFWEIEEPCATERATNPDDIRCEEHFQQTHYRMADGRYVVRLPFRDEEQPIIDSSSSALKRFFSIERKLARNSLLREKYCTFMKEYLDLEHMSAVSSASKYMIPHHCVIKPDHADLKLRVVFDASCSGLHSSLNEHLLIGEKLQSDIRDVLLRFRRHKVAFSTDIVKMYRMILVDPQDRAYQRIFWRFSAEEELRTYELNTVTYGLACAPFQALRVIKQLIEDHGHEFPHASSTLSSDIYVDDILTGADSTQSALLLQQQLINLLGKGKFQLSKWSSNSPAILSNVSQASTSHTITLTPKEESWVKILGLQWNPSTDTFQFFIAPQLPTFSKRGVLSTVARIYDPLGFLTPTIFLMKGFIQDLWKLSCNWDDPLPPLIREKWESITNELPELSKIQIPRYLQTTPSTQCQLVGFADASERGYAAVIYLRVQVGTSWIPQLLIAKSKLAPTKTISIPRLELSAAWLLAQLHSSICTLFSSIQPNMRKPTFFTDSSITLAWINSPSYNLKVFVANRVSKIQDLTEISSWNHVASEENPCDIASRGVTPSQLPHHALWWNGPSWLTLDEGSWPKSTVNFQNTDLPEIKATSLTSTNKSDSVIAWMGRFSSFYTLIKAFSWIKRWFHNCRHAGCCCCPLRTGRIKLCEFEEGLLLCIRKVQQHYFLGPSTEFISKQYTCLKPFCDSEGIWRVGGRLRNSSLSNNQKHPILLPNQCHFSDLLVDYYHYIYHHPGPLLLQAIIQKLYWIPSLRRLIRHRGFLCTSCFKSKAKALHPVMGDLPTYRVNGGRAFLHVGVDFAGPFVLKESLRRKSALGKAYLCLYVCMATKAIHLEIVSKLTTDSFIACFQRFSSRRGLPSDVYSDCGSNFLGASRYFKDIYQWLTSPSTTDELLAYAVKTRFKWHFNPPQTPHMGGIWEAGVKSVKTHFRILIGNTHLTYEEMSTVFSKIEAMLNSRPLCPLSSSPDENDYLCPGHFLVGGPLVLPAAPSLLDTKENLLDRWQLTARITETFWRRWQSEYLATLQRRPKWTKEQRNLVPGDLVLLKQDSPPLQWPLARIVSVHPGTDGVVRVATIKTSTSIYKRPAVRLVPLLPLTHPAYPNSEG